MKRRVLSLITVIVTLVVFAGCGGGGGGTGRYTLSSEIPTPGGILTSTSTGTGSQAETDPEALLASAWEDFRYGAYSSAIGKFNQVLTINTITDRQRAEAYNGLGWSQTKSSGAESAISNFSQSSSTLDESRIGLAAALIQRGQKSGITQAIQLLEQMGLGSTGTRFTAIHPIGVSNAEAHALLAFAYFWRGSAGDDAKARSQINVARTEDPSPDGAVSQIYQTLKNLGLSGI